MPKTPSKPPIRPALTRERIVSAALALVDRAGTDALSMRAVAAELGVEAMSLYRHVASKEALVEGMVARILDQIEVPPPGTPWREAMTRRARSTRLVFLEHPAATLLVQSCATMTPSRLAYADAVTGLLLADGFTPSQAYKAFLTLDSYVFGFLVQELSWPHPGGAEPAEVTPPEVPPVAFPHFARVMASVMEEVGRLGLVAAYEAEFVFGLELVLHGLARLRHEGGRAQA